MASLNENRKHTKKWWFVVAIIIYFIIIMPGIILAIGNQWLNKTHEGTVSQTTSIEKMTFSRQPEKLQQQLQDYLKTNHLNAVAVTTVHNAKKPIVIKNGTINNSTNELLDQDSIFQIGSIQKIFTAVVIQRLIAQGKIQLNEPISNFYPNVVNGNKITIWNLLTHTSGLQDGNYTRFDALTSENKQIDYVLTHMISGKPIQYTYASANYSLLAGIIMQVTHQAYKDNVQQDIIQPLKLQHTFFYQDVPNDAKVVYPTYVKSNLEQRFFNYDIKKQMSFLIGAGQMYSSPEDYYIFLRALINGKLIPKRQMENFFPKNNSNYYNGGYNYYGYFEAGGSQNGYNLSFMVEPNKKAITVLFTSNFMLIPNKKLTDNIFLIANREQPVVKWFPN